MPSYDLPFVDWISIGLNKESLNKAINAIKNDSELQSIAEKYTKNRAYINKILREEIFKQFDDARRPRLEVVLNAIDARPKDSEKEYRIDINWNKRVFEVGDIGTGMNLEDILTHLTIPFSTKKNGVDEIGRFGVGFLSTFNYCLTRPGKTHVNVDTSTGKEGYIVDFYSTGESIEELRMRIKKKIFNRKSGTQVKINTPSKKDMYLVDYFMNHLNTIPSPTAKIFVQGKEINADSDAKWYNAPVEFEVEDKTLTQRVGFLSKKMTDHELRKSDNKVEIQLTSQGVLVKKFLSYKNRRAQIYFPSGVKVVEGRDEFKIDENYRKAVAGIFLSVEEFLKQERIDDELRAEMAGFIPTLASALSLTDITQIQNINSLRNHLFSGKRYILDDYQFKVLFPFFGKDMDSAFTAESAACSYWRAFYGSGEDLFNENFEEVAQIPKNQIQSYMLSNAHLFPNLFPLLDELRVKEENIIFGNASNLGNSAFFKSEEKNPLYVNLRHPNLVPPYKSIRAYAIADDYLKTSTKEDERNQGRYEHAEALLHLIMKNMDFESFFQEKLKQEETQKFYELLRTLNPGGVINVA